ncbi:A/G-specific adenine glycosylase [Pseudoxanthomonas taiwanensis]|uniref:Adenine DNA glycosylase n=1 Tax=Pseudoxanthomonas taiwanensis TaxID=176598 RepID=A0A921P2L3_9GAMM|nr:A/G-specific adenine glycosylase [Pseudoxanthomonas taiwanensis]KAF1690992.1 A/G-specific adenine glycosylase [Pseudoxanthomonas taiwanensis]
MPRARRTAPAAVPPAAAGDDGFAARLLAWFDRHGRHDLPWQHPRTPYRVWLSEVMLQQTQVATVIPYFERFVRAFPDLPALAAAPADAVMAHWAGLGYYSRARNLHAAARLCVERHGGELPRDLEALTALPGIGRSTAGAILAQAWGDRFPILDGNVKRVLARYHGVEGWPGLPAVEKRLWALAESHLPHARLADYTQAQMDFGATLCTRAQPACVLCPLNDACVALGAGRTGELPAPRPARVLPERSAVVLLAEDAEGRLLLQRRPPTGVWATLWSLPEAEDEAAARAWFRRHLQGRWAPEPLPELPHAFSHYRLRLRPLRLRRVAPRPAAGDNPDLRWVARAELHALALPAPIRKLTGP